VSAISSFRREVDETGNLLSDHALQSDDGTDSLSRKVGKGLAPYAAFLSF